MRRELTEEEVEGNLRYRPFRERGFIDDLRIGARRSSPAAASRCMGEAVYLHKPMLSVPVKGQFEQVLNARYLEREGYGLAAEPLDGRRLGEFLERLPDFERGLAGYAQDGNSDLLSALDRLLERVARPDALDPFEETVI